MLMCRIFDPGHLEGVLAKGVYISHISHISLLIATTNTTQTTNNDLQNRDFSIL